MKWIPAVIVVLIMALVACETPADDEATPAVTQIPSSPTASTTPPQPGTPATSEPSEPVTRGITLTLWTNTEIAPNNDVAGGPTLLEQLSTFDRDREDVSLFVELKTIADQGGTLSYLRTGRSVAPSILPDVILLPSSQLPVAADQGLIFPLDGLLSDESIEDLYPAARELVLVKEQIYGYPFALTNLQHLAYDSTVITDTVSVNWANLVAAPPGMLIYPAAGAAGAELTAHFYAELGGTFVNDLGQPGLQTEPLIDALELIRAASAAGLIDPQSGGVATTDQAWQIYQQSSGRIVQTTSNYYLGRQSTGGTTSLRVLSLPGPTGPLTPTVSAWTWAISTPDAERQARAAELISWLISATNLGEWCLQSHFLPARRSAFEVWPTDLYVTFLRRQVANARPFPAALNNTILTALSDATTSVILGLSTPGESAEEAVSSLRP